MRAKLLSLSILIFLFILWVALSHHQIINQDSFPNFGDFLASSKTEIISGRFIKDLFASLFRWSCGFFLAAMVGIPLGLFLGKKPFVLNVFLPYLNTFRSLSPLAWIPFAVIWFGIGDLPVIFLIFLGSVFPLLFTTLSAVSGVPKVYDQLARDYSIIGGDYFFTILFPSVLPQIVSSLRLVAGLAWIVLVPAEMLAGKEGLGFAILDARNGLRTDLLVFNMIAIALVAQAIDVLLKRFNEHSQVRWGHES